MKITSILPKGLKQTDIAIVGVLVEKSEDKLLPTAFHSSVALARKLSKTCGKKFDMVILPTPNSTVKKAVVVVGLGKKKEIDVAIIRHAVSAAIRRIKSFEARGATITFPLTKKEQIEAIGDGVLFGAYEHTYQTKKEKKQKLQQVAIVSSIEMSLAEVQVIAKAVNDTRRLVDEPSNKMTPTVLARAAQKIAPQSGLSLEVISEPEAKKMGMGAFAAVAQGSEEEGKVIVLRYAGGRKNGPMVGLVGKGITFDTGGLSLKPDKGMETMKIDMAGGATVLGVMGAIAALQPKINVLGVIMAAENSPSGKASRPGDVVTALSGKTVEILNTDAEGRLVVADGITYAERKGATHIVDIATLTGACMVALGQEIVGIMGQDASFIQTIRDAAKATGERVWELPLDDDFAEQLKSSIADFKNIGSSYGGASLGGKFIQATTGIKKPWAHLDIAGPSYEEKGKPWMGRGGTGVMVRTLVELIRRMA